MTWFFWILINLVYKLCKLILMKFNFNYRYLFNSFSSSRDNETTIDTLQEFLNSSRILSK